MAKCKNPGFNQDFRYPYEKKKPIDLKGAGLKPIDFQDEDMPTITIHEMGKVNIGKPQPQSSQVVSTRPKEKKGKK